MRLDIQIVEYSNLFILLDGMMKPDYVLESHLLKVIAHPVRLEILEGLCGNQRCVAEVENLIEGITQSNISQHLTVLRHCGIVDFRREGNKRCYFLTNEEMIIRLLAALRGEHIVDRAVDQTSSESDSGVFEKSSPGNE